MEEEDLLRVKHANFFPRIMLMLMVHGTFINNLVFRELFVAVLNSVVSS